LNGWTNLRAFFVELSGVSGSLVIVDQYFFGFCILVAPFFGETTKRDFFLPEGRWIDYQTKKVYQKGWHTIEAGEVPIVVLVKDGSIIPHIDLAQSTKDMDWSKLTLEVFATKDASQAKGQVYLPEGDKPHLLEVEKVGSEFKLKSNPLDGKTSFKVHWAQ